MLALAYPDDFLPVAGKVRVASGQKGMLLDFKQGLLSDFYGNDDIVSKSTILRLGQCLVRKVQLLHEQGYVHGDVKPSNLVVDTELNLYFVDFGFAHKYREREGRHIPDVDPGYFEGTTLYASQNTIKGCIATRRDDIESVLYVLVMLFMKSLPWPSHKELVKERKLAIKEGKKAVVRRRKELEDMEILEKFPDFLQEVFLYVRQLGFSDEPNYAYI